MSTRIHNMAFGASLLADGRVRFHLWAPGAREVEVCLEGGSADACIHMAEEDEGFFGLVTEMAKVGSLYKYRIDGELMVPDPASRFQPHDVHGPSEVIDAGAWHWRDDPWQGRPWREAVIYELHVGTFTPQGTFDGARQRLDHLVELGVTAVELMPVADFPGRWNWGYDGVLPFAPDSRYGRPEDLKAFIQSAHEKGLMVYLDVVYNHFGPEGNYLYLYAPKFFSQRHHTPWGDGFNLDDPGHQWVRQFLIHNALYWLEEYHFDGLRLDSVHDIKDDSPRHFLVDLAHAVKRGPGYKRHVHLMLENDANQAVYLQPEPEDDGAPLYTAQWNDDFHHALHVLLTGEQDGYYRDYVPEPGMYLQRCLKEGFAYQGETSAFRDGNKRGEDSRSLAPVAFVNFLQNHDQAGNRAFGERIHGLAEAPAIEAALALCLLAPSPPLLFMGQEWGSRRPFPFFSDLEPELAEHVRQGRIREFSRFDTFKDPAVQARIPDPCSEATVRSAMLDWEAMQQPTHEHWLTLHRQLLTLRRQAIVPLLDDITPGGAREESYSDRAFTVTWTVTNKAHLHVTANLGPATVEARRPQSGRILYQSNNLVDATSPDRLPGWSVSWMLQTG